MDIKPVSGPALEVPKEPAPKVKVESAPREVESPKEEAVPNEENAEKGGKINLSV